jgi:hypothetical protein
MYARASLPKNGAKKSFHNLEKFTIPPKTLSLQISQSKPIPTHPSWLKRSTKARSVSILVSFTVAAK